MTILDSDTFVTDIRAVNLLSPPAGITIAQNQVVLLHADVKAVSGTLQNAEFYVIDSVGNSTDLGGFTTDHGEKTWQPTVAGDFTLEVVATDTSGHTQQATNPIQVAAATDTTAIPQASLYVGLDEVTVALNDTVQVVAQAVDSDGNPLQNAQFYLDNLPVTTTPIGGTTAIRRAGGKADATSAGALFLANLPVTASQQLLTVVGTTISGLSAVSNAVNVYGKANAGQPPAAAIRSIASGASLPAGSAGQSVSVTATSGSQPVAQVQLFVDDRSVGVVTAAPYTFSLPALEAGAHSLSAIATDTSSLSKVSAPVVVTAEQAGTSTPAFFTGETALGNGVYYLAFPSGNYFGYYSYLSDPAYLYHFDLGYEYVFDAADGNSGVYFYDFASNDFFYTSPGFPFPYLYDFGLQSTVYYYPDPSNPGHYNTNGVRYFYVFNTGAIISK